MNIAERCLFVATLMCAAMSLFIGTAKADMTVCFEDHKHVPLVDFRATHSEGGFANEYKTDANGCVVIQTLLGGTAVWIHAENRVVRMVNLGIPTQNLMFSIDGSIHTMEHIDYFFARQMQEDYDNGLSGIGPFDSDTPLGGMGGPKITADTNSILLVGQPWVEPIPAVGAYPRIHLGDNDSTGGLRTLNHEFTHALHFAKLSLATRTFLQAKYAAFLTANGGHRFTLPSEDFVAWVEGIAHLGSVFEEVGTNHKSQVVAEMHSDTDCLCVSWDSTIAGHCTSGSTTSGTKGVCLSGDDTIEGVIAGILFAEFADAAGLDNVVDSIIDCDVLTLKDYARCIADRNGRDSIMYANLRLAAGRYGIDLGDNQIAGRGNHEKCFHKMHSGWNSPNPIHLWDCSAGARAKKSWVYHPQTGYIYNLFNSDKCLHKKNSGWTNGNPIHIWDCAAGPNRNKTWNYEPDTGYIRARENPDKCLHKKDPRWENSNPIHLWDCSAGSQENKSWTLWDN